MFQLHSNKPKGQISQRLVVNIIIIIALLLLMFFVAAPVFLFVPGLKAALLEHAAELLHLVVAPARAEKSSMLGP